MQRALCRLVPEKWKAFLPLYSGTPAVYFSPPPRRPRWRDAPNSAFGTCISYAPWHVVLQPVKNVRSSAGPSALVRAPNGCFNKTNCPEHVAWGWGARGRVCGTSLLQGWPGQMGVCHDAWGLRLLSRLCPRARRPELAQRQPWAAGPLFGPPSCSRAAWQACNAAHPCHARCLLAAGGAAARWGHKHRLESPTSGNARPSRAVSRKTSGRRCCVCCVVGLVTCAPRAGRGSPSFLPIAPYIEFPLAARALGAGARARRGHTGMRLRTKSVAGCVHGCGEVRGRRFIWRLMGGQASIQSPEGPAIHMHC